MDFLGVPVTAESFWSLVGSVLSVVGSLLVAVLVFYLARHQFRSNHWWDRREQRYTAIAGHLGIIKTAAAKIARYDMPMMEEDHYPEEERRTIPLTQQDIKALRVDIGKAQTELELEVSRGVFLLSRDATEILQAYLRQIRMNPRLYDRRDLEASGVVQETYATFTEQAAYDLRLPGWRRDRRDAYREHIRQRLTTWGGPWAPWMIEQYAKEWPAEWIHLKGTPRRLKQRLQRLWQARRVTGSGR
jgi:hypothetical protein